MADLGVVATPPVTAEPTAPAFKAVVEEFFQLKREVWKPGSKTETGERSRFDAYVLPALGDKPINNVYRADLVDVLKPLWHSKVEVANKVKRALNGVFDLGVGKDYVGENPMRYVVAALGRHKASGKHHGAVPYQEAPAALAYVRKSKTYAAKKLALELLILTTTRTIEVRGACWSEFDKESATWTVPASRMKGKREHRVPLSLAALNVLQAAYVHGGGFGSDLVFPNSKDGGPISNDGLRQLIVRRYPEATAHGFRSTFRDWVAEKTDFAPELAEHALAHLEGSATVRAYLQTDMFEKRRALMNDWADFLSSAPSVQE